MSKLKLSTTFNFDDSIMPRGLVETNDGNYIVVGRVFSKTDSAFAAKLGQGGDIIWEKTYSAPFSQFFSSITKLSDGTFALTGSYFYSNSSADEYMFVAKLDNAGNIIWQKAIGTVGIQSDGESITATSDGGFIVNGLDSKNNKDSTRVIKFDSSNNIEWDKTFDIGKALSITQTLDGGYALTGRSPIEGSLNSHVFLLRLNENGDKLFEKVYEDFSIYAMLNASIIETENGNLAIATKSLIMQVDIVGNIIWSKACPHYIFNSIIQKDKNNFIVSGGLVINDFTHAYFALLNANTQEFIEDNTSILYPSQINAAILNKNNDLVVCGYTPNCTDSKSCFMAIF